MKYVFLLFPFLLTLSCTRPDVTPANTLVGTWRLTAYCRPTGASGCIPVTVPSDKGVFIRFTNAGHYSEFYENTKPVEYAFLGAGDGSYQLEGDFIRIRTALMSSSNGNLYRLVSVQADRLTINAFGLADYVFRKE